MTSLFLSEGIDPSDLMTLLASLCIAALAIYSLYDLAFQIATTSANERIAWFAWTAFSVGFALRTLFLLSMPQIAHIDIGRYGTSELGLSMLAAVLGVAALLLASFHERLRAIQIVPGILALTAGLCTVHAMYDFANRSELRSALSFPTIMVSFNTAGLVAIMLRVATRAGYKKKILSMWKRLWFACFLALPLVLIPYAATRREESLSQTPYLAVTHAPTIGHMQVLFLTFFTCLTLLFGIVASVLSRSAARRAFDLQLSEERQRITKVLSEQRVTRLQNEALEREIAERKKIEHRLVHVAYHDALTGLHNRNYVVEQLATHIKGLSSQTRCYSALLYINLDRFKSVNEMLGHSGADLLLTHIAKRLQGCIRIGDVLARVGGDEFALLLKNVQNADQAMRFARRLLDVIEEPVSVFEVSVPISASIGVRSLDMIAFDGNNFLRDADTAMSCAKRDGGARVMVYAQSMHEEALAAMDAKSQLKTAIEKNEFEMYYQPLVNLRERTIYGVEALIRWNHPTKGLVGPSEFIDLAEKTGYILPLGSWVLRQACSDFHQLQKFSEEELLMTVNVSTRQLNESNFLDLLKGTIHETAMPPRQLQLEITESIFLNDAARVGRIFEEVRSMGIRIAFDDFGTGYSSLSYLERYPIDTLKIDQSFVHSITRAVSADIVQLIIQLAHTIGMDVSAEGVEEPDQVDSLVRYGCNIAQGFLYSHPIPIGAMKELLRKGLPQRSSRLEVLPTSRFL